MKKHKSGFTLAEVLITLVIIGIIAAMTIPTLLNKTNEQETVVAVKKAYSTLGQAYQRMIAEYGEVNPSYFGSTEKERTENFGNIFIQYLNVQKVCGTSTNENCWSTQNDGAYKFFNGNGWWYKWNSSSDYYKLVLNDGSFVGLRLEDFGSLGEEPWQKEIGSFFVDVNGDKGPNVLGKDVFGFWLLQGGVLPIGTAFDTKYPLADECKVSGRSCTAWVITKGNMDYLRKDVSW